MPIWTHIVYLKRTSHYEIRKKPERTNLKMFSEVNYQLLILSVIISLFVYVMLWWDDDQKSKVLQGYYVIYAVLVGFNGVLIGVVSFVGQEFFFRDIELSVWGRLTILLTFSLMSTQSPLYRAITDDFPRTDDKEG